MKLYLIVAKGKHQGMPIPIKVDLFLMGSDQMCQLRSKLGGISPQHCALITRDEKVFVRDLSGGKTLLNEELMPSGEEWPLHAGDRLSVGPLEFLIQFHEKQLSQRDAEEWALKSLDVDASKEKRTAEAADEPETAASAAASILEKMSADRGVVRGRLRVREESDVLILSFNDTHMVEVSEIAFIKKEVHNNLDRPGLRVLLDFKHVRRLSSSAAEMILDIRRRLQTQNGSLAMCRIRPELHMVFEALDVFQSVRHFDDKDDALKARW